jgi:hypothetical protein
MRVANHMTPWGTRLSNPAPKCYRVACKTAKETAKETAKDTAKETAKETGKGTNP